MYLRWHLIAPPLVFYNLSFSLKLLLASCTFLYPQSITPISQDLLEASIHDPFFTFEIVLLNEFIICPSSSTKMEVTMMGCKKSFLQTPDNPEYRYLIFSRLRDSIFFNISSCILVYNSYSSGNCPLPSEI